MVNCFYYKNKKIYETCSWTAIHELLGDSKNILYINVLNPSKEDFDTISSLFSLHPLTLEDCASLNENPKLEDYENYIFTVVHNISYSEEDDEIGTLPINIISTSNYVLTICSKNSEIIDQSVLRLKPEAERMFSSTGNIYYTLLDTLIDNYFPLLTFWSGKLDILEEDLLSDSQYLIVERIMNIRRNLLMLKRILTGQREVIYKISHTYIRYINHEQKRYLKDVFDHIVKLSSTLEEYRDWAASIMDAHYSYSSSKLNETMQRLTTISLIFMPLTFIAGVYGMNFKYMPELKWKYGYFICMVLMAGIAGGLIAYFKKKKMF